MEHHISKSERRKSAVGMLGFAGAIAVAALVIFLLPATPTAVPLAKLLSFVACAALFKSLAYFLTAHFAKE
jgi:ABC-type Fe3+-siderophore transport system permease subunit